MLTTRCNRVPAKDFGDYSIRIRHVGPIIVVGEPIASNDGFDLVLDLPLDIYSSVRFKVKRQRFGRDPPGYKTMAKKNAYCAETVVSAPP